MSIALPRICAGLTLPILAAAGLGAQNTSLTTPLQLTHDKPFVMVMVNGKGPFRFVIDTGTGAEAFVTGELADELHLPVVGQVRLSDPSKQGGQHVPLVQIESLEVAGLVFPDIKAARHTLSDADGHCDGLLGFRLFRNTLLTLDFPNRRMSLASGGLVPDGEHSVLPFRMPDGIPIIPMHIGDLPIEAQIDTGGTGLSLPQAIVSRLKFESDPQLFGAAQSLSTRFSLKSAKLATDVHLGAYTFTRPFVEINSVFPLTNLGSCAMQGFTLTFDQKSGLVRIESSQQALRLAATPTPVPLELTPTYRPPELSLVPAG
jgi:predicted aspartyl protease